MKPSDRYLKIVEWSDEDRCYVGICPGLMLGGIHGDDEVEVYKTLCAAVDGWIKIQEEDGDPLPPATAGKEYSGKFVVRVGKELHKELAIEALYEGQSLNSYCVTLLKERRAPYGQKSGVTSRESKVKSQKSKVESHDVEGQQMQPQP